MTSSNYRDFHQRYRGTFGWLLNKGKEIPVFIREVTEAAVTFQGLNGEDYFAYADKDVMFKFMPLKRRIVIGVDGEVYAIARRPARQWRRGVCADNTNIYRLTAAGPAGCRVDINGVKNLITDDPRPKDALKQKLSDQFAIVGSVVYLYEMAMGSFTDGTIKIKKGYEAFAQELRDAIRDNKLNYKVV